MSRAQRPLVTRLINVLFFGPSRERYGKRAQAQRHRKTDKPPDPAKRKPKEPTP